jgi:asparagine synthase (glutamine-hydrolysing)
LSGEGADEVFAGYSRYGRATWLWGLLSRRTRTHGVFDELEAKGASSFAQWREGLAEAEARSRRADWSPLQRLQAIDCSEWLPNDLLLKLDRCLMAHGVEGRTPFLDPIVGPFGFGLPDDLKVKGKLRKWLLRKWLSIHLPSAEPFARKKGFNPPVGEWIAFYKSQLETLLLAQPGIAEMGIADLVRRTLAEPAAHTQAAWSLVFYALWHSHHVLGVSADGSIGDTLSDAARRG